MARPHLPEGVGVLGCSSHEPHQRAGRWLSQGCFSTRAFGECCSPSAIDLGRLPCQSSAADSTPSQPVPAAVRGSWGVRGSLQWVMPGEERAAPMLEQPSRDTHAGAAPAHSRENINQKINQRILTRENHHHRCPCADRTHGVELVHRHSRRRGVPGHRAAHAPWTCRAVCAGGVGPEGEPHLGRRHRTLPRLLCMFSPG